MNRFSGGQLLVKALKTHGVQRVFCVPGESYLPVLDALHDSGIDNTLCRHEGGAAMMAEAWGKLTGVPGICLVTRGPGATNATAGLHVALQDSTPMILFIGQIGSGIREREAFQEVDYRRFLGTSVKWVAEIDDAERMDEMISRAFHVATSGRPGPVALALPEDALSQLASVKPVAPWKQIETYPGPEEMSSLASLLESSTKPLAILGGTRWNEQAVNTFRQIAQTWQLPVACSFRRQMLFDHTNSHYAGDVGIGMNPELRKRVEEADLILMVGGRFSEMPSQNYTLLDIPSPRQTLVHVHPGAEELGRVYRPELAIHASPSAFTAALGKLQPTLQSAQRQTEVETAHKAYRNWSEATPTTPGDVQMSSVMQTLAQTLPDDAILTNGAGNYASWIHRFWKFRHFGSQLAPTSGSMGYGLPAAIAAKLCQPERTVVAFAGDGCFQMTMQEFGTAVQAEANIIVMLIDNGIYGTIRMHQEKTFPGRVSATTLKNPDFAAVAAAYGAFSTTVTRTEQFAPALQQAIEAGKPALIHIHISPEAITPTMTLTQIRQQAEAAKG
ncbi:thiamine pyrophosphate-binding protein [Granulosicoccus antarcticus]|uniref:Acetolactate synthase isozyme 2 large subunit n=1 Tax=Granulosicoccus antarcticus IMCC3135 TaxID=1192854 RepID=A0A2Z2NQ43_9GAMM|nr:thiamine pyrophosphate-binding protein [Granulosicoccus antarcticus]ASJ72585.1 Acetolactate synthase isozyme 2 large subunit [Granulosicoccus antarcticus IMCC3135]